MHMDDFSELATELNAVDDVCISSLPPDLLNAVLDALRTTLGLRVMNLGRVSSLWREAVRSRRDAWSVLKLSHSFGDFRVDRQWQTDGPVDVAALQDGAVVVTDTNHHRLLVFSQRAQRGEEAPRVIGSQAPLDTDDPVGEAARFHLPRRVATEDGETVFVTDWHRVQKVRLADGMVLSKSGTMQFNHPTGVCVAGRTRTRCARVYVCDMANQRVVVLGTDLAWHCTFGSRACFSSPHLVAALDSGEVYVADSGRHDVQAFVHTDDNRMEPLRTIGGQGVSPGLFVYPMGLAFAHGLLIVTESSGRRVQVLTLEGVPLQLLPVAPMLSGVCVTSDGRVCAAAHRQHAMHVLEMTI